MVNEVDKKEIEVFVGCGSFGVVRLQFFRGIKVAVKELLPRTLSSDVLNEAMILPCYCHPYLPHLFGIATLQQQPYRIVMINTL